MSAEHAAPGRTSSTWGEVEVPEEALGPYGSWPWVERRVAEDRRARSGQFLGMRLRGGRRAAGRRRGERSNIYVERFSGDDLGLALAILALNVADAVLTLDHLDKGGSEANPLAQGLLDKGTVWFTSAKALMIAACLIVLTLHKRFRGVRTALRCMFVFYLVLLYYHLFLQAS